MTALPAPALLARARGWLAVDVADGAPSDATLKAYTGDLAQHLDWLTERGQDVDACDRQTLKEYRAYLVDRGYQPATITRKLASLRRFYGLAHSHGVLAADPAHGLRAPKDRKQNRVKFLTPEQTRDLLALPDVREVAGIRDRAMLVLLYAHTLRIAEVCGLRLGDIDLAGGEAGMLRIVGKGRKERPVYLTPETRREPQRWLTVRRSVGTHDDAVFVSLHNGDGSHGPGYGLDVRGARYMVDKYLTEIGAKRERVSCHALRHSGATHALMAGAPLEALQDQLGHSDPKVTRQYAQVVMDLRHNPASYIEIA